jgi:hypothetical protein
MQENMDQAMQVTITGPKGIAFDKNLSRIRIQGDFNTKIDLTELEPHDIASERRELMGIVQVMGPAAFMSPTFSKRFFTSFRFNDPQMVEEFQEIAGQMMQAEQGSQNPPGGPKPTGQGSQGSRFAEGRSQGRAARTNGGG